jgi:large subunit GTPase 1
VVLKLSCRWRVVERSNVVVQIVDARNPLLFRCKDLEAYVKEVDPSKKLLLLVNKSDLLSPHMRYGC